MNRTGRTRQAKQDGLNRTARIGDQSQERMVMTDDMTGTGTTVMATRTARMRKQG
jgi:orotate phosphoribosyltransferase